MSAFIGLFVCLKFEFTSDEIQWQLFFIFAANAAHLREKHPKGDVYKSFMPIRKDKEKTHFSSFLKLHGKWGLLLDKHLT